MDYGDERPRSTVVIDYGGWMVKAGFGGDDYPRAVFPSVIGKPKRPHVLTPKDCYVGDEARSKRGVLNLTYPIQNQEIDWDGIEEITNYIFNDELRVCPEEQYVFISEFLAGSAKKLKEIFFEKFNVAALYVQEDPEVCSLYAAGRGTGIVVDLGYTNSKVTTLYEGRVLRDSCDSLAIGGKILDEFLERLLLETYRFTTFAEKSLVHQVKEEMCYVSLNLEREDENVKEYELPDGTVIPIGSESYKCPECLFRPELVDQGDSYGIHQILINAIRKCNVNLQRELKMSVVLSGGGSMFRGLGYRIKNELILGMQGHPDEFRVVAQEDRMYSTWVGGSILCQLGTFQQNWISREEYTCSFPPRIIGRRAW